MKFRILLVALLLSLISRGNMASTLFEGTYSSSALSSYEIDILHEKIFITIDQNFKKAHFEILYFIHCDTSGIQMPLLFHAADFANDFRVRLDEEEVNIVDIPDGYEAGSSYEFRHFRPYFNDTIGGLERSELSMRWEVNPGHNYTLEDFKYFEVDLAAGAHVIRVTYEADCWMETRGLVNEYSFRYSLSPAKYWRSFGDLEIRMNAMDCDLPLTSTLGAPDSGDVSSIAFWKFDELPAEYFHITYTPPVPASAKFIYETGPFRITLVFAILIIILQLWLIRWWRKRRPARRFSLVVILGSLFVPFIIFTWPIIMYNLIDSIIGPEAGNHGYTFILVLAYPWITPIYWVVMWGMDKYWAAKFLYQPKK